MSRRTMPRKEVWARSVTPLREMVVNRLAGLLGDLEANGPPGFTLANGGSINGITIGCYVSDPQANDVTSTKFAIDCQVE
jgi:hypothetical protein